MIWVLLLLTLAALAWFASEWRRWPMGRAARDKAPGKFADLPQGLTHYRWDGPKDGPVVVCVHGLSTASYVWDAVVRALTMMGFRVLRYDLFGRGLSDRPKGRQNRAFFLKQLDDLLQDQGVDDIEMMLGYSMGGSIVTGFAAADPNRVARLVLLAPAGLGHTPGRFARFVAATPVLGDWLMRVFGGLEMRRHLNRTTPSAVEGIAQMQADETRYRGFLAAVLSSQRNMLAEDTEPEHHKLAKVGTPVLAIWGDADAAIPASALGRLAQINRNARQVTLEGATHGLPHTHPREIHAALQEFLREV